MHLKSWRLRASAVGVFSALVVCRVMVWIVVAIDFFFFSQHSKEKEQEKGDGAETCWTYWNFLSAKLHQIENEGKAHSCSQNWDRAGEAGKQQCPQQRLVICLSSDAITAHWRTCPAAALNSTWREEKARGSPFNVSLILWTFAGLLFVWRITCTRAVPLRRPCVLTSWWLLGFSSTSLKLCRVYASSCCCVTLRGNFRKLGSLISNSAYIWKYLYWRLIFLPLFCLWNSQKTTYMKSHAKKKLVLE